MAAIEYFDSAHSAYAYPGSRLFMEIARVARRSITHRPMDLAAVVAVTGPISHQPALGVPLSSALSLRHAAVRGNRAGSKGDRARSHRGMSPFVAAALRKPHRRDDFRQSLAR